MTYHIFYRCNNFNFGSVWIGLILLKLKTYCWNHYSKIIFKCVNSAVGPIFNEKIDKKWNLWVCEQCTDALFTEKSQHLRLTVHWTVTALLQKRIVNAIQTHTRSWVTTVPLYGRICKIFLNKDLFRYRLFRVCLDRTYFVETENLLLKSL